MLHSAAPAASNILRATHDLNKQGIISEIAVKDSIINGKTLWMRMEIAGKAQDYDLAKLYQKALNEARNR